MSRRFHANAKGNFKPEGNRSPNRAAKRKRMRELKKLQAYNNKRDEGKFIWHIHGDQLIWEVVPNKEEKQRQEDWMKEMARQVDAEHVRKIRAMQQAELDRAAGVKGIFAQIEENGGNHFEPVFDVEKINGMLEQLGEQGQPFDQQRMFEYWGDKNLDELLAALGLPDEAEDEEEVCASELMEHIEI